MLRTFKESRRSIQSKRLWIQVKNTLQGGNAINSNQLVDLYNPIEHGSSPLTWYSCGPTVYDSAHLGHARTYVTTDILRRIISSHFQIPLHFAMGITDIDDKIIQKGKQRQQQQPPLTTATTMTTADTAYYLQIAKQYEEEFLQDMDRLNILRPDAILKVSHYVAEIIDFVQILLNKQHAYQTQQGIYFRITSLSKEKEYDQFGVIPTSLESRLEEKASGASGSSSPQTINEEDYDGNLSTKSDIRDFALWKLVPKTEPGWESPWGWGRPGWHIECSTMTYQYFGNHLDIHSGGIDLKFPHHTNEIVQSECHHGHVKKNESWVRLWLHTGHLHIIGRKMSKSLKNFITIPDYFTQNITNAPADDFRIFCLQHRYSSSLTYSPERIIEASMFRKKVESFFILSSHILQSPQQSSSSSSSSSSQQLHKGNTVHPLQNQRPTLQSKQLMKEFSEVKEKINQAFKNDFDTGTALQLISELIGLVSEYMKYFTTDLSLSTTISETNADQDKKPSQHHPIEPILAIHLYIKQLGGNTFGLQFCEQANTPSLTNEKNPHNASIQHSDEPNSSFDLPSSTKESINIAIRFRSKIKLQLVTRMKAIKQQLKQEKEGKQNEEIVQQLTKELDQLKELMQSSDELRHVMKAHLSINIVDLPNGESTWKKSK